MRNFITEVFRDPPVLISDRLMLRRIERRDAEDMFEYASIPEVTRYLTWEPHPDLKYTRAYIAFLEKKYRSFDYYDWAVCLRDSGKMIGTCGFTRLDSKNLSGEIGYVINPAYRGKGYATEAAGKVMEYAFRELGLYRVEARFIEENIASRRVMEKLNMTFEGIHRGSLHLRGSFVSVGTCAILQDEYNK